MCYCAHADDMILGAGGYLTQLSEENEVVVVCTTDGFTHPPKKIDRRGYAKEACKILGIEDIKWLGFPTMSLEMYKLIEINKKFEDLDLSPDLLITNTGAELNRDHRITYESARVVTRPKGDKRTNVLCHESTVWRMGDFKPQFFVDISETIDEKIEAMLKFKSELRPYPHPRSPEAIRARAGYWGLYSGMKLAEPFEVIRWYG